MVGRRTPVLVLALTLLTASAVALGSPLATLSLSESGRSVAGDVQEKRLAGVREKLLRRQALADALDRRAGDLAMRLERLRVEAGERADALRQAREEAARLERRIDRLAPRLSAHAGRVEQGRAQAGRVLADLAGLSRQVDISPKVRARLLAISPVVLNRLRSADARLAAVREEHEALIERHGRIGGEATRLQAELTRLETKRQRLAQERAATLRRKAEIEEEVVALQNEQTTIARRIIIAETDGAVGGESGKETDVPPAPPSMSATAGAARGAAVKGAVIGPGMPEPAVHASNGAAPRLMAAAIRSDPEPVVAARADAWTFTPPAAKPGSMVMKGELDNGVDGAPWASLSRTAALAVGAPDALALALPDERSVKRPMVEPLMPVPGRVPVSLEQGPDGGADGRSISIRAAPGQPVAAPEGGRVAFAGPFKSYGLLLIIEHDREYHILLWGFSRLDVEPNDRVETGQIVGVMAVSGDPQLHVELRRNGQPVNPLPWLAASSSKVRG